MEFVVREITMTTVKGSKPEKEWTNHHNDIVKTSLHFYNTCLFMYKMCTVYR